MAAKRLKQLLMGIGLLTVIGVLAMVGLIAYVWWDTRNESVEIDTDDDFDVDGPAEDADVAVTD